MFAELCFQKVMKNKCCQTPSFKSYNSYGLNKLFIDFFLININSQPLFE